MGGSKTFQVRHSAKVQYFDISNVVNNKVAKFVKQQPHGGTNHLFSAKKTKSGGKKAVSHIKVF